MTSEPTEAAGAVEIAEPTATEVAEELPVVARLAIEIRSDGRRTVARGAIQDIATGQDVRIEVTAGSLVELGLRLGSQLGSQLAATFRRSLFDLPRAVFRRRDRR